MKENSILKIKVFFSMYYDEYVHSTNDLKKYHEWCSGVSDLLERYVRFDVIYVPVNSILFFSCQKDLFFLATGERFYYFEMRLTNGDKYFIPGNPEEVLTILFNDFIIKD